MFETLSLPRPSDGFKPCNWASALIEPVPQHEDDPIAEAYARGLDEGRSEGRRQVESEYTAIGKRKKELDARLTEAIAANTMDVQTIIRSAVETICEDLLAIGAVNKTALLTRIERATRTIEDLAGPRRLMLHPDDAAEVGDAIGDRFDVAPDITLERGTVHIETPEGGVEDSPALWRAALRDCLKEL